MKDYRDLNWAFRITSKADKIRIVDKHSPQGLF